MAFKRCSKHPDIVLHRPVDGAPGLRCRVCEEIRPLKREIRRLRSVAAFSEHYEDPGKGQCMACRMYRAEGEVKMFAMVVTLCRSCAEVFGGELKKVRKSMQKRAEKLNERRRR